MTTTTRKIQRKTCAKCNDLRGIIENMKEVIVMLKTDLDRAEGKIEVYRELTVQPENLSENRISMGAANMASAETELSSSSSSEKEEEVRAHPNTGIIERINEIHGDGWTPPHIIKSE